MFVFHDRVELVRTQVVDVAIEQRFLVVAYCFMPDHLHLLAEGSMEDSDGRRFIVRVEHASGFHFARRFGERLWQRYGHERTLRNQDATLSVARYIFENPIRAGLVARAEDYPFLGSEVYSVPQVLEAVQWTDEDRARSG